MSSKKSVPKATSAAKTTRPAQSAKKEREKAVAIPKRIRDLALQMIGTERGADAWLAMRNPELSNHTPADLIAAGRAEVVELFIESNLSGDFG